MTKKNNRKKSFSKPVSFLKKQTIKKSHFFKPVSSSKKKKILIANDQEGSLESMKMLVEDLG